MSSRTISLVEDVKYVSDMEELPKWSFVGYKPSCSTFVDPSIINSRERRDTETFVDRKGNSGDQMVPGQKGTMEMKTVRGDGHSQSRGRVKMFVEQYENTLKSNLRNISNKGKQENNKDLKKNRNIH